MKVFLAILLVVCTATFAVAAGGYLEREAGTKGQAIQMFAPTSANLQTLTLGNRSSQCLDTTGLTLVKFRGRLANTDLASGADAIIKLFFNSTAGTKPTTYYSVATGEMAVAQGVTSFCFGAYSTASPATKYVDILAR